MQGNRRVGRKPKNIVLNSEQQKLITDHYRVIETIASIAVTKRKIRPWEKEELIGELHFRACRIINYYQPEKYEQPFEQFFFYNLLQGITRYTELRSRYEERYINTAFETHEDNEDDRTYHPYYIPSSSVTWEELNFLMDKAQISARERRVIYLRYKKGLILDEIASLFTLSTQTIRAIILKALNKIRTYFSHNDIKLADLLL